MKSAIIICILFQFLPGYDQTQIERGRLVMRESPAEIEKFISDGYLNLAALRSTCNFLTNHDIKTFNGDSIPRRKNAFVRHIKHINEQLEELYVDHVAVNADMKELLYELAVFEASLIQKTKQNTHPDVTFSDKVSMWWNGSRSNCVFEYQPGITDHEANNINVQDPLKDPPDSPFWHKPPENILPDERFDQMAKLKKIRAKKNMVVLFDKLSYDGSAPKIDVLDTDLDNGWSLKWGDEVHTDIAGSRIFAALGYDIDHPYFYGEDELTLVFDSLTGIKTAADLVAAIQTIYNIDLTPFISSSGSVTNEMTAENKNLEFYCNMQYVRFKKCGLEGRPDRVKRIGSILPDDFMNEERRELRGALLAHQFIGNWDTREQNTLITLVHMGNYQYRMSGVFSDLGTSFGVVQHYFPPDFKVGLVNSFSWECASRKNGKIVLGEEINSILPAYESATYDDLLWMADKIMSLDSTMLRNIVKEAHWPGPVAELYFHKLASRRASIIAAFGLDDPHPILFDKNLMIMKDEEYIVKNGVLMKDIDAEHNPESFISEKGRFDNYGH